MCFCGGIKIFRGGDFLIFFYAVAVQSGVGCCPKYSQNCSIKAAVFKVSRGLNKVADNEEGIKEVKKEGVKVTIVC